MAFSKIMFIGNLGRDPEMRRVCSSSTIASDGASNRMM